ncbi:VOC family protein [Rubrivivax gelatinosus]|uniref:Glyoxalase/bleomycin resistance protein/dioxygenase n=1 Tax=Rubrivivax gelatinosus (strain NBRC 100245 / IL144) TaxID=983917 RepID=I0HTV4_RUBGI|nr:VOC family protein [Rubrivivax gelatinosus]BAL96441.1 glyoxalase/bleomycin resistance protein/dioxygenase [Rubrivivax gelatinosus IL144]
MAFAYTILYVDDVARSLAFYGAAFGLAQRFLHEGGDYGELDTGGTTLAFSSRRLLREIGHHPQRADADAPCFEIALTFDDVPAAMRRAVEAGARPMQEPRQMPWGQTVAYVADPEGVLIELCTPIAPLAAQA